LLLYGSMIGEMLRMRWTVWMDEFWTDGSCGYRWQDMDGLLPHTEEVIIGDHVRARGQEVDEEVEERMDIGVNDPNHALDPLDDVQHQGHDELGEIAIPNQNQALFHLPVPNPSQNLNLDHRQRIVEGRVGQDPSPDQNLNQGALLVRGNLWKR